MQLVIRKLSESHKELEGAILEFRGNFLCRQSSVGPKAEGLRP